VVMRCVYKLYVTVCMLYSVRAAMYVQVLVLYLHEHKHCMSTVICLHAPYCISTPRDKSCLGLRSNSSWTVRPSGVGVFQHRLAPKRPSRLRLCERTTNLKKAVLSRRRSSQEGGLSTGNQKTCYPGTSTVGI
jgi:hypothetical protein